MGQGELPCMEQAGLEVDALSSSYRFTCPEGTLEVTFTTPLLLDDLMLLSRRSAISPLRPRAWLTLQITLLCDEELCLDEKGQSQVEARRLQLPGAGGCLCREPDPNPFECGRR